MNEKRNILLGGDPPGRPTKLERLLLRPQRERASWRSLGGGGAAWSTLVLVLVVTFVVVLVVAVVSVFVVVTVCVVVVVVVFAGLPCGPQSGEQIDRSIDGLNHSLLE